MVLLTAIIMLLYVWIPTVILGRIMWTAIIFTVIYLLFGYGPEEQTEESKLRIDDED